MKKIILLISFLVSPFAFAEDDMGLTSLGLGVSRPSQTTSLFTQQNPASHARYDGLGIHLVGISPNNEFENVTSGGLGSWGNGDFGVALGATQTDQTGADGDPTFHWGLGSHVSSLNFSFGFTGSVVDGGSTENAGFLFKPTKDISFGVVGYDVFGDLGSYAMGLNVFVSSEWTFSVDVLLFDGSSRKDYWIGAMHVSKTLEFSGGIRYIDNEVSESETEPFLSIGLRIMDSMQLSFSYQTTQKYLVSFGGWF